jgi:hypothetical protein
VSEKVQVGSGWRLLRAGEMLAKGDQIKSSLGWCICASLPRRVQSGEVIRRRQYLGKVRRRVAKRTDIDISELRTEADIVCDAMIRVAEYRIAKERKAGLNET